MKKLFCLLVFITAMFVGLAAAQNQPTGQINGAVTLVVSSRDVTDQWISSGHVYLIDLNTSQGAAFLRGYTQAEDVSKFICDRAPSFAVKKTTLKVSSKRGKSDTATYLFDAVPITLPTAAAGADPPYTIVGCLDYGYGKQWDSAYLPNAPNTSVQHDSVTGKWTFQQSVAPLQAGETRSLSSTVVVQ